VRRLSALAQEMKIKVKQLALVINRSRSENLPPLAAALKAETGASLVTSLADDEELRRLSEDGGCLQTLPLANPVVAGIDRLLFEAGVPTVGGRQL